MYFKSDVGRRAASCWALPHISSLLCTFITSWTVFFQYRFYLRPFLPGPFLPGPFLPHPCHPVLELEAYFNITDSQTLRQTDDFRGITTLLRSIVRKMYYVKSPNDQEWSKQGRQSISRPKTTLKVVLQFHIDPKPKKLGFSSWPSAAIFDLVITSLLAGWRESTSVIFHVQPPETR